MMGPIIVSANQAWNLVNFRAALIRALLARGYRVAAASCITNERDRACAQALTDMGCTFHEVPIASMGVHPLGDLRTLAAYAALMRRLKPAAFLGWTIKPNIYGMIAAQRHGVPTIANISGLGTAFLQKGLVPAIARQLYRLSLAKAGAILFQNEDDRREFVRSGIADPARTHIVNGSGVDTRHFAPQGEGRNARGRFLMIARVMGDKGVREYVDAARILKARAPGLDFQLLGFQDVENRSSIPRAELDGWTREGVITLLPPVDDVRPMIAAADCVVLPSYREGTSRVLLEAAAMARPLVATDVPGCREVVRDAVNGYLAYVRDAQSLAEAMWKIYSASDAEWLAMGVAGRSLVVDRYSDGAVIATYLDLLTSLGVAPPS